MNIKRASMLVDMPTQSSLAFDRHESKRPNGFTLGVCALNFPVCGTEKLWCIQFGVSATIHALVYIDPVSGQIKIYIHTSFK